MPFQLPPVNLANAIVGTQGSISLAATGLTADPSLWQSPAHLRLYNESGYGLALSCKQAATSCYLPAGGWTTLELSPGESAVIYQVQYILKNATVTLLLPEYYAPGESVPPATVLGNAPPQQNQLNQVSLAHAFDSSSISALNTLATCQFGQSSGYQIYVTLMVFTSGLLAAGADEYIVEIDGFSGSGTLTHAVSVSSTQGAQLILPFPGGFPVFANSGQGPVTMSTTYVPSNGQSYHMSIFGYTIPLAAS